ncbi:MAG: hypothetical protein ACE5JL_00565 [Dehalococcoidia bacterium]
MDGDFRLDLEEIAKNIESAEVISVFFPLLRKTLLLDTRCDIEDGPMVKVVPMVDSVEERFRVLKRMRPRLPRPESVIVIPWPKYVSSLKRLGLWDKIAQRIVSTGSKDAVERCDECYQKLVEQDNAELAAVIKGENYYTLWEAPR